MQTRKKPGRQEEQKEAKDFRKEVVSQNNRPNYRELLKLVWWRRIHIRRCDDVSPKRCNPKSCI